MIAGEPVAACWRKVRTPYGDMPRKTRGRRSCKIAVTESVTEKTPPVLWQQSAGKVEKAREELTAHGAILEAGQTPCGARQNSGSAAGPSILGHPRITINATGGPLPDTNTS